VCGLDLPVHARFCARCGSPQAAPRPTVDTWVMVIFGLGVVVSALVAILYSAIALYPSAASTSLDPATLRAGSVILASALGILCLLQSAAIVGLIRGREWGRVVATGACVIWSLTCIGVPVAVLVLMALWRARSTSPPSRPLDSRG